MEKRWFYGSDKSEEICTELPALEDRTEVDAHPYVDAHPHNILKM